MTDSDRDPDPDRLNSQAYWEHRFRTDWSERGGPEQSAFFAGLAVDHLPGWFRKLTAAEDWTVCDWGCAEGEGTERLSAGLPEVTVTGVDFSEAAIQTARSRHPSLAFVCADFLASANPATFDVLFTSNTLEHFEEPWTVLDRIAGSARRFLVVLIPFRENESDREPEHEVSFDYRDLTLARGEGWQLAHAEAIDASRVPGSRWNGEQILLIYGKAPELARVSLADLRLVGQSSREQIDQLTAAGASAESESEVLTQEVAKLRDSLRQADQGMARVQGELARARSEHAAELARLKTRQDALLRECGRLVPPTGSDGAPSAPVDQDDLARLVDEALDRIASGDSRATETQGRLDEVQAELGRVAEDLDRIRTSRTWRWTEPIRRFLEGERTPKAPAGERPGPDPAG